MTNERDRNREEQLERLFRTAGPEYLPVLTPDPGLPARIRAMAAAGESGREPLWRRWTPRVAWVSLAGAAAVAASIFIGGYMGYHAATDLAANESLDAQILTAAWSQSGSVDDLGYDDEVAE